MTSRDWIHPDTPLNPMSGREFQGSEKEEREEWKERCAEHGRGLNNFTGSSPGNQRPTKKDAEE